MEKTFLRPRETRTDAQTILKLNDLAPTGGQSATPQCNFKFEARRNRPNRQNFKNARTGFRKTMLKSERRSRQQICQVTSYMVGWLNTKTSKCDC